MGMKYLVVGGDVISRNDGQRHYVNAHQLYYLYGFKGTSNCKNVIFMEEREFNKHITSFYYDKSVVVLRPRYDGNYTLPPLETKESYLIIDLL